MAAEPETGLVTDYEMTMAAGPGSRDAENGVKMTARDRFTGPPGSTGPGEAPDAPARRAAINLRTLLRHGLTRRDGAWALA